MGLEGEAAWLHIHQQAQAKLVTSEADATASSELQRDVVKDDSGDLEEPWQATVDGVRWRVRLNDFPDQRLYSLIVGGSPLGEFSEWTKNWKRREVAANLDEQSTMVEASSFPAIAPNELAAPRRSAGDWHSRYLEGDHEAVWLELVNLGESGGIWGNLCETQRFA